MTAPRARLGVAVVGLGVGEQHSLSYAANPHCELRWLYDLEESRARSLAHRLGAGSVAHDYEQILDDPLTEVVSIASYDDAHFKQVLSALSAGKHVFVEKPICQTIEELADIKKVWARRGGELRFASNLVLRSAPLYVWLRSRLHAGEFGDVYALDAEYLYGRLEKITEGWRKDVLNYSIIAGGGVHMIDLLCWMTGQRPDRVSAIGNRICSAGTGFQYDDFVTATFEYQSGLIARVTANFGCVQAHQHVLRLYGTAETFVYDDAGARCHVSRDPSVPATKIDLAPKPVSKAALIPAFVDAIVSDRDISGETQTHFDVMSIIAACDESLKTGSARDVQYI